MAGQIVSADMDAEGKLDNLERRADRTDGRLEVIEKTQTSHGGKLDEIIRHVSVQQATPRFNFHEWARTLGMIIGLTFTGGSIISGLAVWLVLTLTAADTRVTDVRLSYAERKLDAVVQMLDVRPTYSIHGKTDKAN